MFRKPGKPKIQIKSRFSKKMAIVFAVLFAAIGTYLLLGGRAAVNNGTGPYNLIVAGQYMAKSDFQQQESYLQSLVNTKTNLSFRTFEQDPNNSSVQYWEGEGRNYYYTACSSDFDPPDAAGKYGDQPVCVPASSVQTALASNHRYIKGIYLHEYVSYQARLVHQSTGKWDWIKAAKNVDWALMDNYASQAKARGVKLIWSEPEYGWSSLNSNTSAKAFLTKYSTTVVPMFATNFNKTESDGTNGVTDAMNSALFASRAYKLPLGESVQSWYFRDAQTPSEPTPDGTYNLINMGYTNGATYFQIEGEVGYDNYFKKNVDDMVWGSAYMTGVYNFANYLGASGGTTRTDPGTTTTTGDSDGDGVLDTSDKCPTQPGPSTNGGCPVHIIPLYHYYNPTGYDSFYTTTRNDAGYAYYGYGYADCRIGVMDGQNPGSVPLWRYWNGTGYDHFYTINRNDAGYAYYGYAFEGQEGWVYPPGTSASLYNFDEYWAGGWIVDHFYTIAPYGQSPNWSYQNYSFDGTKAQVFAYNGGC